MRTVSDTLLGLMATAGLGTGIVNLITPLSPAVQIVSFLMLGGAIFGYAVTVTRLRRQALRAAVSAFADRELLRQSVVPDDSRSAIADVRSTRQAAAFRSTMALR